jgi:hypothetical protein
MGINGAHQHTYSIEAVTSSELEQLVKAIWKKRIDAGTKDRSSRPIIDVDASWLYRKFLYKSKSSCCLPLLIRFCCYFTTLGFDILLICDGSTRHHSKRATVERRSATKRSQHTLYTTKLKLVEISNRIASTDSLSDKQKIEIEQQQLIKKIKSLENVLQNSMSDVGDNFYTNIKHEISLLTLNELGSAGARIEVIQSEFQADSTIAHRCFHRISEIVFTSDSNLAALCGCQCVAIKEFNFKENYNRNNSLVKDIKIFSPDFATIESIARSIHIDVSLPNNRIKKSQHHVFEGISNIRFRALIAVGLGCDTFVKGIAGVTAKSIRDLVDRNLVPTRLEEELMQL